MSPLLRADISEGDLVIITGFPEIGILGVGVKNQLKYLYSKAFDGKIGQIMVVGNTKVRVQTEDWMIWVPVSRVSKIF